MTANATPLGTAHHIIAIVVRFRRISDPAFTEIRNAMRSIGVSVAQAAKPSMRRRPNMRKIFYSAICVATAAAFATPALAQSGYRAQAPGQGAYAYAPAPEQNTRAAGAVGAGVVGGTVAGVGVSQAWWGAAATAALPATAVGAAAIGGVAGMGTVAAVDAFTNPCRGFAAMFGLNRNQCVDGHYVGNAVPPRTASRYR
jgi:hypothetical protein